MTRNASFLLGDDPMLDVICEAPDERDNPTNKGNAEQDVEDRDGGSVLMVAVESD